MNQKKTKLPINTDVYPDDTNLLHFIFHVARNDDTLRLLLKEIQFIRDHPDLLESDVRKELAMNELAKMPYKANRKLPKR